MTTPDPNESASDESVATAKVRTGLSHLRALWSAYKHHHGNSQSEESLVTTWIRARLVDVGSLWQAFFKAHINTLPNQMARDAEVPVRSARRESWWTPRSKRLLHMAADHIKPIPWAIPYEFPQPLSALEERLRTRDRQLADEILRDAERLFEEAAETVRSAERRATSLQGTVAIAASVVLTGGGLVVGDTSIHSQGWREGIAIGIALLTFCLVMTALRARRATSSLATFYTVSDHSILDRAQYTDPLRAKTDRAAHLLYAYGRNAEVGVVKVIYLKKASAWFRLAVMTLAALAITICVYVAQDGTSTATSTHWGTAASHVHSTTR